ncbi:fibronectin type III domain-containing protein [Candidatus Uhrbacteria bacterium]|nr:fibronectin type III domain-containing protein [Candidatus Uhrbacteria bacterium]
MATLTPMPKGSMPPPPPAGGAPAMGRREPEIVVMPEKYYGMALKMEGKTQAELEAMAMKKAAPVPPKAPVPAGPIQRRPIWPFVLLVFVVVLVIAGLFVWFNRDALFPQPKPPVTVVETPTPKPAPNAPANLVATVTSGTAPVVSLSWVDGGGEKTGFRIERRDGEGAYLPLTPLPPSATTFLDVTVRTAHIYQYRVFAIGPGGESAASNVATARIEESSPLPAVPTLPPGGLDSDSDGLSDVEEAIFGTDSRVPDSDRDGFLDGNEVFHLYNPAAKAPVRLLDSGLVTAFVSPAGWSLFIPKGWTSTLDSADGSRATVRTGQGETFRISIQDNPNGASLADWYVAGHAGASASQLREILTKGGLTGLLGPERTDAQFAWDGKVFVLQYDLGTRPFINFRTSYEMMLNSLRLSGVPVVSEEAAPSLDGPGEFLQTTSTVTSTTP